MIRNRFSILLAERSIKITRVAKDTGISRSTLNNISKNDTDMIRLETVNNLCKYLNVTPCEFFDYEPLDISFSMEVNTMTFKLDTQEGTRFLTCDKLNADLFMDVVWGHKEETIDMYCELDSPFLFKDNLSVSEMNEKKDINLKVGFDDEEKREYFVNDIYSKIDSSFYRQIYDSLIGTVEKSVTSRLEGNITKYIEEYLDVEDSFQGLSDSIFADSLRKNVKNVTVNIITDDFNKF